MNKDLLEIKEVSDLLNVSTSTVRNWEKKGLLFSVRHPINNYRLYKREDLQPIIEKLRDFNGMDIS